jgi:hypothetical protein
VLLLSALELGSRAKTEQLSNFVLQMLFTDIVSFVIPNVSQYHLQPEYIDVDSFQI